MEAFGKVMAAILTVIIGTYLSGIVLLKYWEWFVMTQFDVAPINMVNALGIAAIISYTSKADISDVVKKEKEEGFWVMMSIGILKPVMVLFFGWVLTLFM